MPGLNSLIDSAFEAGLWLRNDAAEWCRGRNWIIRIPVWLMLAYFGVKQAIDPQAWTIFSGINLPIHEGGHLLFRALGWEFLHVAGGTLLQLFAPIASGVMFFKQRDYFAIAFCLGWLSTNLMSVGVYMADARALALPLVTAEGGGGGIIIHDWQYLFSRLGLLQQCEAIGWLTRQAGNLSMLAGLAVAGWLMYQMYAMPPAQRRI
jgi:hypothetical protein